MGMSAGLFKKTDYEKLFAAQTRQLRQLPRSGCKCNGMRGQDPENGL